MKSSRAGKEEVKRTEERRVCPEVSPPFMAAYASPVFFRESIIRSWLSSDMTAASLPSFRRQQLLVE